MFFESTHIMKLVVHCDPGKYVGRVSDGLLDVIPIIGGTVDGQVVGTIVPLGADWNTATATGVSHVYAKYMLKTHDDIFITIENQGKIDFSKTSIVKTTTTFQVAEDSKYSFLNEGVYIGTLDATLNNGTVIIEIFRLN